MYVKIFKRQRKNIMGYIIVIEGTDGSGKKTQTDKLYERLLADGYNVRKQSFPNYDSPSASPVKMYLNGDFGSSDMSLDAYQASTLYAVDRLCTYNKDLKEFYNNDGIILFDRYVESNMLHQAGKIRDLGEVERFLNWLDNLEFNTLKLPRANKVIFLDVPVEKSIELAKSRGEYKSNTTKDIHESNADHLLHAYNSGKYVSVKYSWKVVSCLDAENNLRSIDDISDEIYNIIIDDVKKLKGER